MKHTKGKWEVKNGNEIITKRTPTSEFDDGDRLIAKACLDASFYGTNENRVSANAKLISVAPELLEALIELKKAGLGCYGKKEQEMINNAINKATI